ncbi:PQQ-like beta-propeller repeat protein [uncultured Algimonas sp.]|uniref:outer membrane protein assembly factor BamB family protein n=1 Tax=uncultured Algimonas sp. TaxID=1547920 RepID=UPI002639490E|nr:PQQ-like beta-propeller repeat protein [uncultured Algimonas sp.]
MNFGSHLKQAGVAAAAVLLLGGCATLDRLNPFDGGDGPDQGDVAGADERISILELNDTLSVGGAVTPDQIVLPPAYVNTDWPQVGGNVSHVVQHTGASGPLERIWSRDVGDGSDRKGFIAAPPVIANGVIYVKDSGNTVRAFSETSGDRLWEYEVKITESERTRTRSRSIIDRIRDPRSIFEGSSRDRDGVGGGVAFDDGVLYVTSGLGVLTALDATTGQELWRKGIRVPIHSAPTVANGRVFAVTDDNEIMAFDARDKGAVLWTYQGIVETARMLTVPAPAVMNDVVIAPFSSGELVALRVQNGGVLWQDALASSTRLTPLAALNDIAFGPAIADGYVVATAQSGVMTAFDFRTGQRVWTQPAGSIGMPWIAGDFIFTVTTDGKLAALSKIDGSVVWIRQLETFRKPEKRKDRIVWSGPVLAGERLVIASSRGQLLIVSPYDGSILGERDIGKAVMVPPIIANQTVYLLNNDAKLIALR